MTSLQLARIHELAARLGWNPGELIDQMLADAEEWINEKIADSVAKLEAELPLTENIDGPN